MSTDEVTFDRRDRAVLEALEEHGTEIVSVAQLRKLYRRKTDVRQKDTMKDRIRFLTKEGPFERDGFKTYQFLGI